MCENSLNFRTPQPRCYFWRAANIANSGRGPRKVPLQSIRLVLPATWPPNSFSGPHPIRGILLYAQNIAQILSGFLAPKLPWGELLSRPVVVSPATLAGVGEAI
jgi:hypothetical protein